MTGKQNRPKRRTRDKLSRDGTSVEEIRPMKKRRTPNQATPASPLDNPVVETELRRAPEAIHAWDPTSSTSSLMTPVTMIPPARRPRLDFGDVTFDIARPGDRSVTNLDGVARMAKQNGSLREEAARQMAPGLPLRRTLSHDPGKQLQEILSQIFPPRKRKRMQRVDGEEMDAEKLVNIDDRGIYKTNTESNDLDVTSETPTKSSRTPSTRVTENPVEPQRSSKSIPDKETISSDKVHGLLGAGQRLDVGGQRAQPMMSRWLGGYSDFLALEVSNFRKSFESVFKDAEGNSLDSSTKSMNRARMIDDFAERGLWNRAVGMYANHKKTNGHISEAEIPTFERAIAAIVRLYDERNSMFHQTDSLQELSDENRLAAVLTMLENIKSTGEELRRMTS